MMDDTDFKKTLDTIRDAESEGRVVIMTVVGLMDVPIEQFCSQDADGILYDLNRDEVTTLTLGSDGMNRWINDYAVAKVIRYLRENQK